MQGSAHGFELICSTIKLRNDAREEIGIHWRHKIDQDYGKGKGSQDYEYLFGPKGGLL